MQSEPKKFGNELFQRFRIQTSDLSQSESSACFDSKNPKKIQDSRLNFLETLIFLGKISGWIGDRSNENTILGAVSRLYSCCSFVWHILNHNPNRLFYLRQLMQVHEIFIQF